MKTMLYAAGALLVAVSTAQAASTVSDRAGGVTAPTAQGERDPRLDQRGFAPVMLDRDIGYDGSPSSPANTGAAFRSWSGNDNEG